ncbi:hypothetical protein GC088_09215 [Arthrobacter sp. JZ12]|uniref:hypothetical protein n=1 Tax=Arthrobacter sp. JZ12 TaxID=2654190 RepID=UPI002B473D7C|nr:hypothetical protein [Arthrobacter sp. JZ12]WRH25222.1 hypothetical protein GC088_09215 [Arthrobacter sp. JZ12]
MNRVVNVMRMQLINRWIFVGLPLIILGASFALTLLIWFLVPAGGGMRISGGSQAVMWYFFALGIQSLTLTFPFSQGLSITRRTFFLGTLALFTLFAVITATTYWVLGLIEQATSGWGVDGWFFAPSWIASGPWYQPIVFYFASMMALFLVGFWAATIYKRWRATGLLTAGISVALLLVGTLYVIGSLEAWPQVGEFLGSRTQLDVAGWLAVLALALAGGSFLTLRRAEP